MSIRVYIATICLLFRSWDIAQLVPVDRVSASETFDGFVKAMRVLFYIFLFVVVLNSGVLSILSLLWLERKAGKQASSYITQYPVHRTVQSALHFTSLTDLFNQTPYRLLWEASSHMLQLMCEGCSYIYSSMSIAKYSFIQLSELEQCRVKETSQGFNTAAQDSNPGSRSRESEALPLSHCALRCKLQGDIIRAGKLTYAFRPYVCDDVPITTVRNAYTPTLGHCQSIFFHVHKSTRLCVFVFC